MSFLKSTGVLILVLFAFSIGCGGKGEKETDVVNQGGDETANSGGGPVTDAETTGPEVVGSTPGGTTVPTPTDPISGVTAPAIGGGTAGTGIGIPTGGGTTGGTAPIFGTLSPTNTATIDPSRLSGTTTSPTFVSLTPTYQTVNLTPYLPPPPKNITTDGNFSEVPGADFFLLDGYGLSGLRPLPGSGSWAQFRKKEGAACENFIETWVVVQFPSEQQYLAEFPDRDYYGNTVWRRPKDEWFDLRLKSCNLDRSQCQDVLSPVPYARLDDWGYPLELCPSDPYSREPCFIWFHGIKNFDCTQGEDVGQAEKYVVSIVPNQNNPYGYYTSGDQYLEVATPASLRP